MKPFFMALIAFGKAQKRTKIHKIRGQDRNIFLIKTMKDLHVFFFFVYTFVLHTILLIFLKISNRMIMFQSYFANQNKTIGFHNEQNLLIYYFLNASLQTNLEMGQIMKENTNEINTFLRKKFRLCVESFPRKRINHYFL